MYSTTVIPLSESTLAQQEDADMAGNEARCLTGTVKIKQRCQFEGLEGHGQRKREREDRWKTEEESGGLMEMFGVLGIKMIKA